MSWPYAIAIFILLILVASLFGYWYRNQKSNQPKVITWTTNPDFYHPGDTGDQYYDNYNEPGKIDEQNLRILRGIGSGHFGTVFLGELIDVESDEQTLIPVAIKVPKGISRYNDFRKERDVLMKYGNDASITHIVHYYGWSKVQPDLGNGHYICIP